MQSQGEGTLKDRGKDAFLPRFLRVSHRRPPRLVNLAALVVLLLASLLAVVLLPARQGHAETPTQRPAIGINLGLGDDIFTDVIKSSANNWSTLDNILGYNAPEDDHGWPIHDAAIVVWNGPNHMDGTYHLVFTGQADLATSFGYGQFQNKTYDPTTNTTSAQVVITHTDSILLVLQFSNTRRTPSSDLNTGVTNVHFYRPTSEGATTYFDGSTLFTPWLYQTVEHYKYLRFMAGTNWNTSVNWSDRTSPDGYYTQRFIHPGESGFEGNLMAFEYMVRMANDTNRDLYICVPAMATDDYVTKLAQLMKYGSDGTNPYTSPQANPVWAPLNSNLNLYIEYSNEVWNPGFQAYHQVHDAAQAEYNANHNTPLAYDGDSDLDVMSQRYYARRILQISDIFRGLFGDNQMITRIRPLVYWQYDNIGNTAQHELQFLLDYYDNADGTQHVANPHPIPYYIWGGGGAAYFGSNNNQAATVDALFAAGVPESTYQNLVNVEGTYAHLFGLHYMAYEGSWGSMDTSVGNQGRIDPRAQQALVDSVNDFARAGGENYTAGTYGQWDELTHATDYPLVKGEIYVNSDSYTPPAPTLGTPVSGSNATVIDATAYDIALDWMTGPRSDVGRITGYVLNIGTASTYQVGVNVANTAAGGAINVYADGVLLSTVSVPNTGSRSVTQTVLAGSVSFTPGVHSIVLRPSANATGAEAASVNALVVQPGSGALPNPQPAIQSPLPSGWQGQDIGSNGEPGVSGFNNGTFSIKASGYDIWYDADGFYYVSTPTSGDTTIIARVVSLSRSDVWAKAGVMIRESLDGHAANAIALVNASGNATFEDRLQTAAQTNHPAPIAGTPPYWVKLVRQGNTFTGYGSTDGQNWTSMGSDTINMASNAYVGLALTAHNNAVLATAVFDNVSINGVPVSGSTGVTPTPTPGQTPTPGTTPTVTPSPTPSGTGTWTKCADENGTCTFSGTHQVRYGANGSYNYQTATGSIACNNATFGDPAFGVVKECDVNSADASTPTPTPTATATPTPVPTSTTWTHCANEGGTCTFSGTHQVRYGANGSYYYQTAMNSIACNNATFGDPIVGVVKSCDYQ